MSNNIYNFNNVPSMPERVLSALAYLTFGAVGFLLVIISAVMKIGLKPFVKFNCYQAILLGVIFAFLQITYGLFSSLLHLLSYIPIIGSFINSLFQFFIFYLMAFPLLFGFSFLALLVIALLIYLFIKTLAGSSPTIPFISENIKRYI